MEKERKRMVEGRGEEEEKEEEKKVGGDRRFLPISNLMVRFSYPVKLPLVYGPVLCSDTTTLPVTHFYRV